MSRCDHRPAAGLQRVVASAERACNRSPSAPFLWCAPRSAAEGIKVDAMETSGSEEEVAYSCRAEEKDYDLGHLPPLLEDEVSGGFM